MAIEETKVRIPVEEEDSKKNLEYQQRIRPKYSSWIEGEKIILEVVLPGIPKQSVQIKDLKDYFMLRAVREIKLKDQSKPNKILYSLDVALDWEIEPEKTTAHYEEGLLRVEMKLFNPLEKSSIVPINGKNIDPEKITKSGESDENFILFPDFSRDVNYKEKNIELEIALPGVKEENILLRALPDVFDLIAFRDKITYRANSGFGANIIPEKTSASYKDGLLKIRAVIHDRLDDAKEIKV